MQFNDSHNQSTVKANNRSLILKAVNAFGEISRADLARLTGLTKTSVTKIVKSLIKKGILVETGIQKSQFGRKPILLKINNNSYFSIGLYISRDFIYTNAANLGGQLIYKEKCSLSKHLSMKNLKSHIKSSIDNILAHEKLPKDKVLGIGVASIGPLDLANGIILNPPNFKGLKSIPVVDFLQNEYGLPAVLDNDMNAAALAEKLFGHAKECRDFIYVGVTNGIGAGIVLDNSLFRGHNGFAGEIGHISIDMNGAKCACGNTGCLELYANIPGIVEKVQISTELGYQSSLTGQDRITWESIVHAANENDSLAAGSVEKLAYYLSIGLVSLINSFDPEIIFLGHEIALAKDIILNPLQQFINQSYLSRYSKKIKLTISKFGQNAPNIGAPSLVLNNFFNGEM